MNSQQCKLCERFDELVISELCCLSGETAYQKLISWYLTVFNLTEDPGHVASAKNCIDELYRKTQDWLNENDKELSCLTPQTLKLIFDDPQKEYHVGDPNYVLLHCNIETRLAMTKEITQPIPPKYIKLYHYTSLKALEKIIRGYCLKMSLPDACNDINEHIIQFATEEQRESYQKLNREHCFVCLSKTPISPVMWGLYGDRGNGCALCFNLPVYKLVAGSNYNECLLAVAANEGALKQSFKSKKPILISEISYDTMRPKYVTPQENYYLYDRMISTKWVGWEFEKEMRLTLNRDEFDVKKKDGGYYTEILMPYLEAVILGPKLSHLHKEMNFLIKEYQKDSKKKLRLRLYQASSDLITYDISTSEQMTMLSCIDDIPLYPRYKLWRRDKHFNSNEGFC